MSEVGKVSVWIPEARFNASEAEDNFSISLAGEVLGGVQRLGLSNSETALQQNGVILLPPYYLQEFKILCIARADL